MKSTPIQTSQRRLEFIDLAKGICIICVMVIHLTDKSILSTPYIMSFRIPFYFFICGLFFSSKYTFKQFFFKKINVLIIPFLFFTGIFIIHDILSNFYNKSEIYKLIQTAISPYHCINGPLWFLICLFSAYLLYYFINSLEKNELKTSIYILCISIIGFYMSRIQLFDRHIILPFFLSSSMTSLIFIYLGSLFRRKLHILEKSKNDYLFLLISLIIFLTIQFFLGYNQIDMSWNRYSQCYTITVLGGISGSLTIIYLCKFINKIPIISYIGRYSLIALGTHIILLPYIRMLVDNPNLQILILLLLLCPIIYVFTHYFPKFCAIKPFIKI